MACPNGMYRRFHRFAAEIGGNISAFFVLESGNHVLHRIPIKERQIQVNIIQAFIAFHPALQGCTHHAAQQLRNICGVHRPAEGHHGFRPWAIPTRREVLLEKYHPDFLVVADGGGIHMANCKAMHRDRSGLSEGVHDFVFSKLVACALLYGGKAGFHIGGGCLAAGTV